MVEISVLDKSIVQIVVSNAIRSEVIILWSTPILCAVNMGAV